jgi:hypothetical protein
MWDCIGIVKMVGAYLDEMSRDLSAERIRAKANIHSLANKPTLSALREKLTADIDARTMQLDAFLKRHPELEARAKEQTAVTRSTNAPSNHTASLFLAAVGGTLLATAML